MNEEAITTGAAHIRLLALIPVEQKGNPIAINMASVRAAVVRQWLKNNFTGLKDAHFTFIIVPEKEGDAVRVEYIGNAIPVSAQTTVISYTLYTSDANKVVEAVSRYNPVPFSDSSMTYKETGVDLSVADSSLDKTETTKMEGGVDEEALFTLYYRLSQYTLDKEYLTNSEALRNIDSLLNLKSAEFIDTLFITAYASPEGSVSYNEKLSKRRAETFHKYLLSNYPQFAGKPIKTEGRGVNWDGFLRMAKADENLPNKDKVLQILCDNLSSTKRQRRIEALKEYESYIFPRYYPKLRSGVSLFVLYNPAMPVDIDFGAIEVSIPEPVYIVEPVPVPYIYKGDTEYKYIRPIAIKTNLLFDLASALNIELEVPLGKRFSVAGEYIFPWWLWEKKQYCLETLTGGLEGRYWFKPNYKHQDASLGTHNPLTSWFGGLYTNLGYYDLEWDKEGYQGEFYVAMGVSAGFVQPLSRNISLEFSLGIGYLSTDYRHYHAVKENDDVWRLIRQNNGNYKWFGPTKAKISFIWYPHIKKEKKGGNY